MSSYDDLGGGRTIPAAYDGCIHRPCTECGAQPDEVCTFEVQVPSPSGPRTVRKQRHCPCVSRTKTPSEASA